MKKILIVLVCFLMFAAYGHSQEQTPTTAGDTDQASTQDQNKAVPPPATPGIKGMAAEVKEKSVASAKQTGSAVKETAVVVKDKSVAAAKKIGPALKESASEFKKEVKKLFK